MSWLLRFARRNPVVVSMLAALAVVFGIASLISMPLQVVPDVPLPEVLVIAADPGAAPDQVASGITMPIEQAVAAVSGLQHIDSSSVPGFAVLTLTFRNATNMRQARSDVQNALQGLPLPAGATQPSVVGANFSDVPVQVLALTGPDASQLTAIATGTVVPDLSALSGIGQVQLRGGTQDQVRVVVTPAALRGLGETYPQFAQSVAAGLVHAPEGTIAVGSTEAGVEVSSAATGVAAVRDMPIVTATTASKAAAASAALAVLGGAGAGLPLLPTVGQVAKVTLQPAPTSQVNVTDGGRAVLLYVTAASGADQVRLSAAIDSAAARLRPQLPAGVRLTKLFDDASYIRSSVGGAEREGLLGILFAIVIIFLFLRVARATLAAVLAIPLSLLTALLIVGRIGVTLNIMTLAGMAVAVGRVVDDAIVVIENVYRRLREEGARPGLLDAAVGDVAMAITTSTATTVAVFVPLGLVTGPVGAIFRPFALAVSLSLLASLAAALTVVPLVLQAMLLRRPMRPAPERVAGRAVYRRALGWCLDHRAAVLIAAAALFFGSAIPAKALGTEFLPSSGPPTLDLQLAEPSGTPLATTETAALRAERALSASGLVAHDTATIGSSQASLAQTGSFQGANEADFFIALRSGIDPSSAAATLRARLAPLRPAGGSLTVSVPNGETGGASGYAVVLMGGTASQLAVQTGRVVAALARIPGMVNVQSNLGQRQPEVAIRVNPADAAAHGLDPAAAAQEIGALLNPAPVGTVAVGGLSVPVVVALPAPTARNAPALGSLQLQTAYGTVSLGEIADIRLTAAPGAILRHDQQPAATVQGDIVAANTGGISSAASKALRSLSWPSGMTYAVGGITQQQNQAFRQLGLAMLAALAIVYMLMVLAFGGAGPPFAILFSLPLAVIGAVGGLWITRSPIGLPALIGMLMLIGIVVTNAVVLVDLVQQKRRAGLGVREALLEAGATRLRPILMTACATVAALLPLAAGLAEGAIISQSLAVVVIGGLFTSTLLTLLVVPVVYSLVAQRQV